MLRLFVRPISAGRTLDDTVMVNGCQAGRNGPAARLSFPIFYFLFSVFCCWLVGCGTPGEPTPNRPQVPEAVSDLAARQTGDAVALTFTLPAKSLEGRPLAEPPAVEIYRGFLAAGAPRERLSTRLTYTIPSALVDTYLAEGRLRFLDPLKPEELAQRAGGQMIYMVRTRASKRRASADSNLAALPVYPAPRPIDDVRAVVTETAVELAWSAPQRTTAGAALASLAGYRIYRVEVEPGAEAAAAQEPAKAKLKTPLELLAPASAPVFRDTQFEFGRTYRYSVRSVAQYQADEVESADSQPLVVTPRDTFPPASPKELVAVVVLATAVAPAHIELSWAISTETDWAGYCVYRNEQGPQASGPRQRLNRELLLAPTFRDMSIVQGRRYTYRVSAVDRAGNESPLSDPVSAELPQPEP